MGILDLFGLSSSTQDKYARQARAATLAGINQATGAVQKGTKQAVGAINTGVTGATQALAPAITAAGTYVNQDLPANAVNLSAYGIGDPTLAANAFAQSVKPGYELGRQSILRNDVGLGSGRSGGTEADLQDYAFNQYNNWRSGLGQFDPYKAIALQGNLGEAQGNIYTGQARDLSGLYTGQASALANLNLGAGAANAGLYNQYATNLGQVGQNWGNLAGNLLGAGATLASGGLSGLPGGAKNYLSASLGGSGGWYPV